MKAYVANCTMQNHMLNYSIPEMGRRAQPVPSGRQIDLAGDLNIIQVESFIKQMRKYGLVTVEEARAYKAKTPIVWVINTGKPVPADVIQTIHDRNTGIITDIGRETRRLAALATSHNMNEQAHTPGAARNFEMSIEEEGEGSGRVGEGIAITDRPGELGFDRSKADRRGAGARTKAKN